LTDEPASGIALDPRLEAIILQCVTAEWCKIAVLISRVTDAARGASIEAPPQLIAAHIYALADAGRLNVQGNMRRWRAGEVRKSISNSDG
jgi:hypothetical protein